MSNSTPSILRWGVLGASNIAEKAYLPAFQQSNKNTVTAIASRSIDSAQRLSKKFNIPKAYGNYDALLRDPDIDAIYIPLPIHLHCEWTLKSAHMQKAILVEKPLSQNSDDARMMENMCRYKEVLFAEALPYKFHPLTRAVDDILDSGKIGSLKMIRSVFSCQITDENNIRLNSKTGGGALLDVGSYCVSISRHFAREDPIAVGAVSQLKYVDINFGGALSFPSGIIATFSCGLKSQFECTYELIGSSGRIYVPRGAMVPWAGEKFKVFISGQNDEVVEVPAYNHHLAIIDDFSDAYFSNRPVKFPPTDGLKNMAVLDKLYASSCNAY